MCVRRLTCIRTSDLHGYFWLTVRETHDRMYVLAETTIYLEICPIKDPAS